jgi:hypothetical protein
MAYQPPESQKFPALEPLACRRCGAITTPRVSPGTGPHAYRANCPDCGGFMKWLSKYTPEERAARRALGTLAAMTQRPPSAAQLSLLQSLGDTLTSPPGNMAEASQRIETLKKGVA